MVTASKKSAAKQSGAKKSGGKQSASKKPAAKKPAASKATASKAPAAKKAAAKPAAATPNVTATPLKPISEPLSKQGLVAHIAEHAAVEMRAVKAVLASLEATILASLHKKGARAFAFPGLFKATVVSIPARPQRKGINPFTKEEQVFAAKPASTKVKIRALKRAQDAAK
jgi:nucleoid DNA-binding protein